MAVWWIPLAVELGRKIGERMKARRRKKMLDSILKSWKTTLLGVIGGALVMIQGGMDWKHAIWAALVAAFGVASKDGDVSHSK